MELQNIDHLEKWRPQEARNCTFFLFGTSRGTGSPRNTFLCSGNNRSTLGPTFHPKVPSTENMTQQKLPSPQNGSKTFSNFGMGSACSNFRFDASRRSCAVDSLQRFSKFSNFLPRVILFQILRHFLRNLFLAFCFSEN